MEHGTAGVWPVGVAPRLRNVAAIIELDRINLDHEICEASW
jgi:hypothetical protein